MLEPIEVDQVTLAYPASVKHLMPVNEPDYAKYRDNWHNNPSWGFRLFNDWFYSGVSMLQLYPKPGIDPEKATRHIKCIMRSFEPSHEDKTASCAYLFELWFENAEWESHKDKENGV